MNTLSLPQADWLSLAPEIALAVAGSLILLLEAFAPRLRASFNGLALASVAATAAIVARQPAGVYFHGLIESSALTGAFSLSILLATALGLLAAQGYLRREKLLFGEYPALILWCAAGLLLLVRGIELVTIFVALELLSIALYGLAAFHRREAVSAEAAIKYFLMGALVSSFVLYGAALVYGETGSTTLAGISDALSKGTGSPGLLFLGFLLLVCGFGFKLGVVPFHAWAPDVYQGAPSPFVAFLSVAPKTASAVVLARLILLVTSSPTAGDWTKLIGVLAVASMLVGNLLALAQRDIKRMLAYSGIAHMGYLLIPLAAPGPTVWRPILVYLFSYTLMNGGAFVLVSMLYTKPGEQHSIADLSGWAYRFPLAGACMAICMLSLGGIPPTAGFVAKYLIFAHAIQHGNLALAGVGVFASLIGVVFYLRVIYMLYMKDEIVNPGGLRLDLGGQVAAVIAAVGTIGLGLFPGPFLDWIQATLSTL
ncbi:MAG: NADH-quinone oxidoreductase subunit N [Thermoanaerobaculia bacterium]